MTIDEIKRAHDRYDGNHSQLFELTKDRINWDEYPIEESAFVDEFVCFEDDYYQYALHMNSNNIQSDTIIDIGCQFGVQSFIFEGICKYIGIDMYPVRLQNYATFLQETFPNISVDIHDATVISNMSLGYFNNESRGITDDVIVEKLSVCKNLYLASTWDIVNRLKCHYSKYLLFDTGVKGRFPRCYMGK